MLDQTFANVTEYITDNVYHSSIWDEAEYDVKKKAVNNCIALLTVILKKYYTAEADIPIDVLAHQIVWFMRIDDTFLRAEMGVSYIQMSGVMVNIADKDRSIAPYVMDVLGITPDLITKGVTRRKVGSYTGRTIGTTTTIFRNYGYAIDDL
jgi:hypothetical protein